MAEQAAAPKPEDGLPLEVVAVEHKEGDRADNKGKWSLYKVTFKNAPTKAVTFSTTAGPVLEGLIGKVAVFIMHKAKEEDRDLTIDKVLSEDRKTVLYEPESSSKPRTPRGGGPPDWSMRTPEERAEERRSIEAQTALQYATRTLEAVIQYPPGEAIKAKEDAITFVKEAHAEYVKMIRDAAVVSGSGARLDAGRPAGDDASRSVAKANGDGSSRSQDVPTPEPDSAAAKLKELNELTGSLAKTKVRFKREFGEAPTDEALANEAYLDAMLELLRQSA